MTDYIERESLIRLIESVSCDFCDNKAGDDEYADYAKCSDCHYGAEIEDIADFPAADVRPVVRGRWNEDHLVTLNGGTYTVWRCSECEHAEPTPVPWNYCPNCGAEMKEGNEL